VPDWPGPYPAFDPIINLGDRRGQVVQAIVAVQDGRLFFAGANPGFRRPWRFETRANDEVAVSVWGRIR
jgi:hypothetical protein